MDLKQAIMFVLNQEPGYQNKVSRGSLRLRVSQIVRHRVNDRMLREAIAELRETDPRGAYLCSTTKHGGGYFMAASLDELREHLTTEQHRSMSILSCIHQQAKRAGIKLSGQMELSI